MNETDLELLMNKIEYNMSKKQKPPPPPPPPKRRKINESKQRADQNANNPKKMAEAIKKLKELFKK